MKNLFFVFLLVPIVGWGQKITKGADGNMFCSDVVQMDSISKDQLFSRSMEWLALNYKSAKDVIQHSSKDDGKIICKGAFSSSMYMKSGWIKHTLMLEFKDGRYKYSYSNFVYTSSGSGDVPFDGPMMGKKKAIRNTEDKIKSAIKILNEYLKSPQKSDSDKW